MAVLIVAANNGLPYIELCMSYIHNHNFSIYFTLPALKKRVLIISLTYMLFITIKFNCKTKLYQFNAGD